MAFNYSPKIVTDGLVLYLDAANTKSYVSGSTTWSDVSRGGNSGTLVNGPTFDSGNGGSLVFDGINKRVSCPLSPSIQSINATNALTLSTFIQINFTNENRDLIGINKLSGNNPFIFRANISNGYFFDWEIGGVRQQATYPGLTSDILNKWVQLTATIGNNLVKIYLNGLQVGSTVTVSGNIKTLDADFRVGDLGYNYFKGNISNTQLYNRALSAQEVQQNFNAHKTRFGL